MSAAGARTRLLDDPRVRAEVVALLYRNAGVGIVMNLLSAPLVWLAYRSYVPAGPLLAVLALWAAMQLASAWNRNRWMRLDPALRHDPESTQRYLLRARVMAALLSAAMALLVGVLHFAALPAGPTLSASFALVYVMGASISTLIYVPQVVTFSLVVLGSQSLLLALRANPTDWLMAVLLALVVIGLWSYSRRYSEQLQQLIVLRFQVQDLVAEREQQRNVAEAANLAKSRFFAAASHDVRQPLQAVTLTFHALKHARTPERRDQLIHSVENNLAALRQLFDQVLDISRIDAGAVPVKLQAVRLQTLFDRLDQRFGVEAGAKRIWLRFAPTRAAVTSDPEVLERMLSNLVSNAIKHTENGGVWIGLRRGRGRGRIEVRDSGVGMAAQHHERIFEEFYQVDNAARDRASGLGLGLSIVQRLGHLLGHGVGLASAPGCGSTFWLELPLTDAPPDADAHDPLTLQSSSPVPLDGPARQLLAGVTTYLVENDESIRTALTQLLQEVGAQVHAFAGADAALESARHQPPCDVVISDYRLEGSIDGVEVIQRLRGIWAGQVPSLVLTGDTGVKDLARIDASLHTSAAHGHTVLMHKPVTASRLIGEILMLSRTPAG